MFGDGRSLRNLHQYYNKSWRGPKHLKQLHWTWSRRFRIFSSVGVGPNLEARSLSGSLCETLNGGVGQTVAIP